jgi:lipopolysaccharide/colanic/teichoic acid biosynthesis glycosyltransferase
VIKRIFDITASITGLILLVPVFLFISVLILEGMGRPVIFRQIRAGRRAKPFTIYKFRTMKLNHGGGTVSVKGEDRITPLGSFLRRYKLDELPELWNVLKGDMSFVGPRPDVPEYSDRLKGEERRILELRPGITGPATLIFADEEELLARMPDPGKYNDEVLWPEKVRINLEYTYNRTFRKDLIIIFKTIFRIRG